MIMMGCQKNIDSPIINTSTQVSSSFDENLYLFANPDVTELIKQGKYKSGLEHYTKVGQTTKKSDGNAYESFFFGSNGNDTVTSFGSGKHTHLSGVKFQVIPNSKDPLPLKTLSIAKGESDILIGTKDGINEFILGNFITSSNPKSQAFYLGKGDADFARIKNFTKSKDSIMLAGEPKQYQFKTLDNNLHISIAGDLIAVIEGVNKLTPSDISKEMGIFMLK